MMEWQVLMTSLLSTSWTTWLITVVMITLISLLFLTEPWLKLPPGPLALPIVGSLPFLGDTNPLKAFQKLSRKHGDIFTVYFGHTRAIIFNGYDVIKEALGKHGALFAGRPTIFLIQACLHSKGIAFTRGEVWKEQRRFVLHQLRNYGLGKHTMEDIIQNEISYLMDELKREVSNPYWIRPLLQKAAFNIIAHIAFGERFDYQDEDTDFKKLVADIDDIQALAGSESLINAFPYLRHLPGDVIGFKKLKRCCESMDARYQDWIDDHVTRIKAGDVPDDLLGAYIVEMFKQQDKEDTSFTNSQLKGVASDMTLGGVDTTSTTQTWAILYMVRHQTIQDKVHNAIDDTIGRERAPSMSDRVQLPYIEAVLSEVLRIANVIPLSVPHAPLEDTVFRGYHIPKGTMIIMNGHSVNMNEQLWSSPREFRPERFLDDEGLYKPRDESIPFSMGKRQCLGEGLAKAELFLVFTSLMQQFKFSLPEGDTMPDDNGVLGFTYQPKPFKVIMKQRM